MKILCWFLLYINMNQPQVYLCYFPPETPFPFPSLSHSSRLSHSTGLSLLWHTANSYLWSILHMVMYMFLCYSLNLSHPLQKKEKETEVQIACYSYASIILISWRVIWWFNGTLLQYFSWKIPWMEEPGRLKSMGSLRVGHDWATSLSLFTFMHWRRKWQPTPVFLPGESQGRGSLVAAIYGVTQSRTQLKWLSTAFDDFYIRGLLSTPWLPSE